MFLISEILDEYMRKGTGQGSGWECTVCGYSSMYSTNVRNHVESNHLLTAGYHCPVCDKFCKTRNALSNHRHRLRH